MFSVDDSALIHCPAALTYFGIGMITCFCEWERARQRETEVSEIEGLVFLWSQSQHFVWTHLTWECVGVCVFALMHTNYTNDIHYLKAAKYHFECISSLCWGWSVYFSYIFSCLCTNFDEVIVFVDSKKYSVNSRAHGSSCSQHEDVNSVGARSLQDDIPLW